MILKNYKGTAIHPFPCPVIILKKMMSEGAGKTPEQRNAIICGPDANFILASYHDMAPAKLELKRLLDQYQESPDSVFTFMKDPYKEDEE